MYWAIARYLLVAVLSLVIGWAVNQWRLEKKIADLEASYAKELNIAYTNARNKEVSLRAEAAQIRRKKDDQIQHVNAKLESMLEQLRQRPSASSVPDPTRDCKAASGSELSREDAEFLAREATRADQLRSALEACYLQYESVLSVFANQDTKNK